MKQLEKWAEEYGSIRNAIDHCHKALPNDVCFTYATVCTVTSALMQEAFLAGFERCREEVLKHGTELYCCEDNPTETDPFGRMTHASWVRADDIERLGKDEA